MTTEGKIGYSILCVAILFVMSMITWAITSEKYVKEYSLGSTTGGIQINVNWENAPDEHISLNGVSYPDAISMVDSLNRSLKNNPRISK